MKRIIIIEDDGQPGIGISPYEGLMDNRFAMDDVHPCTYCSNNPANNPNASGVCCCALPDLWMTKPRTKGLMRPYPYYTTYTTNTENTL